MYLRREKGFTLIEVLMVMVIMGLVTLAIHSLYQNTQKHAYTQNNVVDLQQNLRIAMDRLTTDIQMAGFLVPATTTGITSAPNFLCRDLNSDGDCADVNESSTLSLQSASPSIVVARLGSNLTVSSPGTDEMVFTVVTEEMVDLFESGVSGDMVRVIRSPDHVERIPREFRISSKNRTANTLTLKGFVGTDNTEYIAGDLIVKHTGGTHPESLSYTLQIDGQLLRNDGTGADVIAEGISDVELRYILDDGSESTTVTGPPLDPYDKIRGIRVTLTGSSFDFLNSNDKSRQLTKMIAMRNYF